MEILHTLVDLIVNLGTLAAELFLLAANYILILIWIAWWLFAVNWRKCWAVLASGAWAPAVLLIVVTALVWSKIAPSDYAILGNFWWQLLATSLLAGIALICGWLQVTFHWTPLEISLEPPAVHDAGHGHGHGH